MKKILLIALMFAFSLGVYAQREGGPREMPSPEQRAERMTNRMAEQLELSEEQKNKVYEINLKNAQSRQAEMEARRAEAEQRRQSRQTQMQSQIQEVEAVLSPEQIEKWSEVRETNRQRGAFSPQGPRGNRGGEIRRGGRNYKDRSSEGFQHRHGPNRGKAKIDK
ncbi:MAG: DUF4890 domain-containing protein [Cecembia sp.]